MYGELDEKEREIIVTHVTFELMQMGVNIFM